MEVIAWPPARHAFATTVLSILLTTVSCSSEEISLANDVKLIAHHLQVYVEKHCIGCNMTTQIGGCYNSVSADSD